MVRGKIRTISNRSQYMWASSEPSSSSSASPEYTNTPKNQEADLKSYLMKTIEFFKLDINNLMKEVQESMYKQVEAIKEETNKYLKEIQENIIQKVKELNKALQDLKVEVETKETQMEANLEVEILGKRSGITDVSITNRLQEIEKRTLGVEDTIDKIDTTVKENSKHKKPLVQSIQDIQDTMKRPNQSIIGIEENKDSQLK
jgi:prophage DNA circulation protein